MDVLALWGKTAREDPATWHPASSGLLRPPPASSGLLHTTLLGYGAAARG